jgi:hypothetical protein
MPNPTTSIDTSDAAVKASPGTVYWVLVSAVATGGAWQLNDSTDDSGTDLVSGVAPANSMTFLDLGSAPLSFNTGIYADIPGSNITITTGYA